MKYKVGQQVIRKKTCQRFTINKKLGFIKKLNSFGMERMYKLKGPHPSLNLIVRKSELDELFRLVN